MPPVYAVERCAPAAVRADLERLWDANLTLESHPADKFGWLYAEAPVAPTTVFVLRADGAAVGTAGVGVRRFQLGADAGAAGLLADLAVDKAHRSVGPALALVRAGKAFVDESFALAYGFPNKLAEGVFKRAGYQPLGTIGRYAMPLRHAAFATRVNDQTALLARVPPAARAWLVQAAQSPALATIAGLALDAVQFGRAAPATLAGLRQLSLAARPAPDAELDGLWANARGDYQVVAERSRAFVAWRFPPRPERRVWYARARGGGALRAYAVVDLVDGVAHVRDLFGHRADVVAMLACLPLLLYRAGARSMSIRYLGGAWLTDALIAGGLAARASTRMIAVTAGAACPAAAKALVTDPTAWHLTDFDEDV